MSATAESIVNLFREQLTIDIDDPDMDLVGSGLMDSLMLIELLTFLEQKYQITIDFADLEIDNFRSVNSITQFVESRTGG